MRDKLATLAFTLALTAACGFLVAGLDAVFAERKRVHAEAARQRVILRLAGVAGADDWEPAQLGREFAARIASGSGHGADGREVTYFRLLDPSRRLFVFAFAGSGFWDVIRGYLAIDADARRLVGVDFTEHAETPGLGGRIGEAAFKARFAGRALGDPDGEGRWLQLVSEGTARGGREVDAITGASETSRAVERLLNRAIATALAVAGLASTTVPGGHP